MSDGRAEPVGLHVDGGDGDIALWTARCVACDHRWFPATLDGCERCGTSGAEVSAVATAAVGVVTAAAVVQRHPPQDRVDPPFTIVDVRLDDGLHVLGLLATSGRAARPGDRVRATVADGAPDDVRFANEETA